MTKKLLQAFTVLVLASIFIGLGIWQLQRAQEMDDQKKVLVDTNVYPLAQKATPTGTIPPESIAKLVTTTGHYIATYKAPNQKDGSGNIADWEVAILEKDGENAILVVRGLWSDRLTNPEIVMAKRIRLTGTLMPNKMMIGQQIPQANYLDSIVQYLSLLIQDSSMTVSFWLPMKLSTAKALSAPESLPLNSPREFPATTGNIFPMWLSGGLWRF